MRSPVPVRRGLDVVAPFTVYRAIGRRPSGVYVDEERRATPSGGHQLWDLVFEVYETQPGDQLQDRQGCIMLVTRNGESQPVQLTPPEARSVGTAFTHAGRALAADWALVESLLAEGRLAPASVRRTTQAPFNPAEVKFEEDHPLVTVTATQRQDGPVA